MVNPKTYYRPQTLEEALQLVAQPNTMALAGGAITLGELDVPVETLVDLQAIPELKRIETAEDGALTIGAACNLQQVVEVAGLPEALRGALTRAIPLNIRNNTSIGESLLYPERFPEWFTALVAHDIAIYQHFADGSDSFFAIADVIAQPAESDLRQGIVTGIFIPALETREALGTACVARTPADTPIVCAAVFVRLDDQGLVETVYPALSGAAEAPIVTVTIPLNGLALNEANITQAVSQVELSPVSDYRGSAEYRAEMAHVLLRRALLDCQTQLAGQ